MGGRLDPAVAHCRVAVRRALADLADGDRVLVGCSGGADSLALLAAACFEGPRRGLAVGAAVVDHGMQPGSADVAARAAQQARALRADPVEVRAVTVTGAGGPEGAARTARLAALRAAADETGARCVLLGHTRDDQAEAVLLGLARGSGPRSLAGMRAVSGDLRRPFLDLTHDDTRAACRAQELGWWEDPHNDDRTLARARVRHLLLPALERELGPGVREALARTADLLRADTEALDAWADDVRAAAQCRGGIDCGALLAVPEAVRLRVLRTVALVAGCPGNDLTSVHVRALDALVADWHGQRGVDLPGHLRAERADGALRVVRRVSG